MEQQAPAAPPDFSFAQPLQQQPGGQHLAPQRLQARAPEPLIQRLRQAVGGSSGGEAGLAAGTSADPIVLDEDEQPPAAAGREAAAAADVEMQDAEGGLGGWAADDGAPLLQGRAGEGCGCSGGRPLLSAPCWAT